MNMILSGGEEFNPIELTEGGQSNVKVTALASGGFIVSWIDNDHGVGIRVFSGDGTPESSDINISSLAAGAPHFTSIAALEDGSFIVVYDTFYKPTGVISAQRFSSSGDAIGDEVDLIDPSFYSADRLATVGLSDGNFALAWDNGGWPDGIMTQVFDASGGAVSQAVHLDMPSPGSRLSMVELNHSEFFVAWGNEGIFGQRFGSDGSIIGGISEISEPLDSAQDMVELVPLSDGSFFAVWQVHGSSTQDPGILGRFLSSDGQPLGDVVVIADAQLSYEPTATQLRNGDILVAWTTVDDGYVDYDYIGQLLDTSGDFVGEQFPIHEPSTRDQYLGDVVSLEGGDLVAVWENVTGTDEDITARVFDVEPEPAYFSLVEGERILEGDAGTRELSFTIERVGNMDVSAEVSYVIAGRTANRADVVGVVPTGGSVSFAAGETSKQVSIFVNGDTMVEHDETLVMTLTGITPGAGHEGTALFGTRQILGTIIDDDRPEAPDAPGGRVACFSGDPHFRTFDGLLHHFQGVGEFVLAEAIEGDDLTVQIRTKPWGSSGRVSVAEAVATEIDGVSIEILAGARGSVRIDGELVQLDGLLPVAVGGGSIYRSGSSYTVVYANGEQLQVDDSGRSFLNACLHLNEDRASGAIHGLFGSNDNNRSNDFMLRDGTVLPRPVPFQTFYGDYANSWRVSEDEALFTRLDGETTDDFTDLNFPNGVVRIEDLPQHLVEEAIRLIDEAGIESEGAREAAIIDYVLTGDRSFIDALVPIDAGVEENAQPSAPPESREVLGVFRSSAFVAEGDQGATEVEFEVYRFGDISSVRTVAYTVSGDVDAADFVGGVLPSGSVSFAAGETSKLVTLSLLGDQVAELDETLTLTISVAAEDAGDVDFASTDMTTVIENDDGDLPASLSLSLVSAPSAEGSGGAGSAAIIAVTRDGSTLEASSARVVVSGNNSASTADFVGGVYPSFDVSFAPGETRQEVAVEIAGDDLLEGDETFTVELTDIVGATIGDTSTIEVTITDDEEAVGSDDFLLNPEGGIFQVNQFIGGEQTDPTIASLGNGNFVVTWESWNRDGDNWGIAARIFDDQGRPVTDEFRVNDTTSNIQSTPHVVTLSDGRFVVAWESHAWSSRPDIRAKIFEADGTPSTSEFGLNGLQSARQQYSELVSTPDGGFYAVWESQVSDGSGYGVVLQKYDAEGQSTGYVPVPNQVTAGNQLRATITALENGNIVVSWLSQISGSDYDVAYRVFDASGVPVGPEQLAHVETSGNERVPKVVGLSDGSFAISWASDDLDGDGRGIGVRTFDSSGTPLTDEILVNSNASGEQDYPDIAALSQGEFLVVWRSRYSDGSNDGIFARQFSNEGTARGEQFQVANDVDSIGRHVVTYSEQIDDDSLVIVWRSNGRDGSGTGIAGQMFAIDPVFGDSEPVLPDLSYQDTLVHDSSLDVDQNLVVDLLVGNNGNAAASATTTFFWSADASFDAGDLEITSVDHGELAGGSEIDVQDIEIDYALLAAEGAGYVFAVLDADGSVAESDEENNVSQAIHVTFVETGPGDDEPEPATPRADLTIERFSVEATTLAEGDDIRFELDVANRGAEDADDVDTVFYWSPTESFDPATAVEIDRDGHSRLKAGEEDSVGNGRIRYEDFGAYGNGYLFAVIDGDQAIDESDETNNLAGPVAITVSGEEGGDLSGPDLEILSLTAVNPTLSLGDDLFVEAAVTNSGDTDVRDAGTTYYWSATDTFDASSAVAVEYDRHGGLDAGDTDNSEVERIRFEDLADLGSGYIFGVIDQDDLVAESDEINNVSEAVAFTISASMPTIDLTIAEMSVESADLAEGDDLRVDLTVANLGSSAARGVSTTFYWSADDTLGDTDVALGVDLHGRLRGERVDDNEGTRIRYEELQGLGDGYIIAKIDANDRFMESDEGNNTSDAIAITVAAGTPEAPADLTIDRINVIESRIEQGEDFFVFLDVSNGGGSDARAVRSQIYWNQGEVFDAATAQLLDDDHHGLLRAGETEYDERTRIRYEEVEGLGDGYIFAVIGGEQDFGEINDLNNFSIGHPFFMT